MSQDLVQLVLSVAATSEHCSALASFNTGRLQAFKSYGTDSIILGSSSRKTGSVGVSEKTTVLHCVPLRNKKKTQITFFLFLMQRDDILAYVYVCVYVCKYVKYVVFRKYL